MFLQGLNSTRCVHHNSKVLEANLPDNIHFAIFYEEHHHDFLLTKSIQIVTVNSAVGGTSPVLSAASISVESVYEISSRFLVSGSQGSKYQHLSH